MVNVIGVRFRKNGKMYYFDPAGLDVHVGSHVIVETARGMEYGEVVLGTRQISDDSLVGRLKPIMRISSAHDDEQNADNREKSKKAYAICQEKIKKHELPMKLIEAEYTFDNSKLLFYFSAEGRVDFRALVRDLASDFHTRIELRQIGVRDEAKMLGGIGICGRPFCCSTFLNDFGAVSVKMAKEQNLPLNPSKISGACGRLMCCLRNEHEAYAYLNSISPGVGDTVRTSDGKEGEIRNVNVLRQRVRVLFVDDNDERTMEEYKFDDIEVTATRRKNGKLGRPGKGMYAPGEKPPVTEEEESKPVENTTVNVSYDDEFAEKDNSRQETDRRKPGREKTGRRDSKTSDVRPESKESKEKSDSAVSAPSEARGESWDSKTGYGDRKPGDRKRRRNRDRSQAPAGKPGTSAEKNERKDAGDSVPRQRQGSRKSGPRQGEAGRGGSGDRRGRNGRPDKGGNRHRSYEDRRSGNRGNQAARAMKDLEE